MISHEVAEIRQSARLSQAQLASILGVHPMTISKWERGVLEPDHRQTALLTALANTSANLPAIFESAGPLKCLWTILNSFYRE